MPPKSRITDIGVRSKTDVKLRTQGSHNIGSSGGTTKRIPRREDTDELLDVEGLSSDDKDDIKSFLKAASSNRVLRYLEGIFRLVNKTKADNDIIHDIRSLLIVDEDEEPLKKNRIIDNLKLILEDRTNPDTKVRGLSSKNIHKVNQLLTFHDVDDLKLEIGYLLRDPNYGVKVVLEAIEDPYLTIDQLPHLNEQHQLLHNQMLLAYNPMEGIELLECKACGQKTYISGLVTNRSWDEAQDVRGTCYNSSCKLNR